MSLLDALLDLLAIAAFLLFAFATAGRIVLELHNAIAAGRRNRR